MYIINKVKSILMQFVHALVSAITLQ